MIVYKKLPYYNNTALYVLVDCAIAHGHVGGTRRPSTVGGGLFGFSSARP